MLKKKKKIKSFKQTSSCRNIYNNNKANNFVFFLNLKYIYFRNKKNGHDSFVTYVFGQKRYHKRCRKYDVTKKLFNNIGHESR